MSDEKFSLKDRWDRLPPSARIGVVGGGAAVIILTLLISLPSSNPKRVPRSAANVPPVKATMLLPKPADRTVEQIGGAVQSQQKQIDTLTRTVDRVRSGNAELLKRIERATDLIEKGSSSGGISDELIKEIQILKRRLDHAEAQAEWEKESVSSSHAMGGNATSYPAAGAPARAQEKEKPAPAPKLSIIGTADPERVENREAKPIPYMTANSMSEGELLNGMDAPTDQSSRKNPVPAIIRIKSEAILPNLTSVHDIRECFLSVSGYGDMADERAKLRLEMLSCVLEADDLDSPPRIVEAKVEGYIVGEDGRVGMRGRLVSKQGQLIAKTLLAGTLSGFGEALKPTRIQGLDLNPQGNRAQTQTVDPSTVVTSGIAQGVSDAAKSVSEYYLKLADQMMPIVEIDAGRKVTIVFLKGVELK